MRSFLSRFRFGKIAAVSAVAAAAFIPAASGQKTADLAGVAVAPAAVTVSPDSKLIAPVRLIEARNVARAFDRDTGSSYAAFGPSTMTVTLPGAKAVTGLRVFGKAPYRLTARAVNGDSTQTIAGLTDIDLSKLEARWNTLTLAAPVTATALELSLQPLPGGGAGLAELEVWADGQHANMAASPISADGELLTAPQAAVAPATEKQDAEGVVIGGANDDAADNSATIELPLATTSIARAWLVYEVNGLSHWAGAARSINGRAQHGGHVQSPNAAWSLAAEPVAPALLAAGSNTATFAASGNDSYRVRNVRLVIEPHDGWNVIARVDSDRSGAEAILDGVAATGWRPAAASHLTAALRRMTALDKLRLQTVGAMTGTLTIDALSANGWRTIVASMPASGLAEGWNTIALKGVEASALRLRFSGGDGAGMIGELQASGSPIGSPAASPRLAVTFPDHGQYYGDMAYVRGFAEPVRNAAGDVRIVVAGKPVPSALGAFETSVSKADLGIDAAASEWSVDVEAIYPDGARVTRKVTFDTSVDAERRDQIDASLGALFTDVIPGRARRIEHLGAVLELGADALAKKTRILMQPLRDVDMPALDPGMINVTKGNFKGFRFLPHGQRFKKAVKVRLPFDKAKLPSGMTEADIRTYYLDAALGKWQPLEKAAVTAKGEVESLTTHFTDMINAVVQAPDSPEAASFNPTQIKDLKLADPSAGVNLVAPPKVNSMGDVRLTYPLELTPGRAGMTPQLGLTYNSAGGNGWLGVGWDLPVSSVSIDTRWGAPRYEAAKETETYIVDGEQLAPVAHRGALVGRTADKTFRTRIEGGFRRIIRHGDAPSNYWWEIKDKDGSSYFYGADPDTNGPLDEATLKDANGNIFSWALREARDSNGNIIRYRYYLDANDSGTNNGSSPAPGKELYLKTIEYTGREGEAGRYVVTLTRASELLEDRRPDVVIDARGGFKRVTADLLRKITLTYGGAPVRSYELTYKTGAFAKTLLEKVKQYDANGELFNEHEFSYFDEARDEGGLYKGFGATRETWNTGSDNVEGNGLLGDLDASALSGQESRSVGGHLYVGVGFLPTKSKSVGVKVGYATGSGKGLLALVDIDGDGLQDKVFRQGGQIWYRANRSGPNAGASTTFGPKTLIATLPAISRDETSTTSAGPEAYPSLGIVGGFVGVNWSTTDTESSVYFSDVNGDGLVDLVNNGGVLFNHIDSSGAPVFTADSSDTPYPIGEGAIASGLLSAELQEVYERENAANPKTDAIRRWIAPYSGVVSIAGAVALVEDASPERSEYATADGVRVAIQHDANELWSETIAATDYTPKTPSVAPVSVQKGDVLYFRVQSVDDGAYDQVNWAPVIAYTGVPATVDANNLDPYIFDSAQDLTLIASRPTTVNMPFNGAVAITGTLNKTAATSDDAVLEVLKDGAVLASQTIPATATGAFTINQSASVLKDEFDGDGNQIQTGTKLSIRLRIDSRIDLNKFSWDAAAPPTIAYTASPDLDPGAPLPVTEAPVSSDLYPESNLTAPLTPWTAPSDGAYTFEAEVQGGAGSVVLTAKSAAERLAKQTVTIGSTQTFSLTLTAGAQVYFEFHSNDNATGGAITLARVRQVVSGEPQDPALSSALYYASSADILPQRYRGWNAFGYNGNLDAATQPINIASDDLTLSRLGGIDRGGYQSDLENAVENDSDPTVDTSSFTLKVTPYLSDFARQRLKGADPELWVSGSAMSASRQGKNYIADPTVDRFAGARAVPRMGATSQRAVAGGIGFDIGGIGVNGGVSKANSTASSLLEFKDMNGDRFPDVIAKSRPVQFSPMTGGLEAEFRPDAPDVNPQETSMETVSFSVGGSYAKAVGNVLGDGAPKPAVTTMPSGENGQLMASLGVSGDISKGSSDVQYDLVDINGDGLPDRVSAAGEALSVAINLGYDFAPEEHWGVGKINEGDNEARSVGGTAGGSIGFNNGNFGWGGGINTSANESGSRYSLQDINGDGLPDSVRVNSRTDSVIAVAFNTGGGFTQPYDWGGANGAGLANSRQRTDGGGAYFTYGVCVTGVAFCVVINPGADYTRSVGRTESAIADIDGDGYPDHLTSTSDGAISAGINPTGRTNLLRAVKRPLGASFEVAYSRAGNTYAMQQSRWVMSRLAITDGQAGDGPDTLVSAFAYADGVYERRERQFYGFRQSVETHLDMAAAEAPYRTITRLYRTDSFYLKGFIEKETVAGAQGNKYTETENAYVVRDEATGNPLTDLTDLTAVGFPMLVRTDKRWFEGQTVAGKTTFETFEYDEYGNISRYIDGSDQGPADDVEAVIAYHRDLTPYIIKANSITVRSNGVEMRRRTATFQGGTGNMLEAKKYLADGSAAVVTMTYTADGNLAAITGPANHRGQRYQRLYAYDPDVRTHVTRVADSFGYASTAAYDPRWGLPTESVDINNQKISTSYDAKGRITDYTGPYQQGSGLKTILMEYHPEAVIPWALTKHLDADRSVSDYIETATFIDGLGRVTQTKKDHALHTGGGAASDVMIVSGRIRYDGLGRISEQYYPVTEPLGAPGAFNATYDSVTPTRTTYDVIDRPLTVANPADETTRFAYDFGPDRLGAQQFRTRVTDANNIAREAFRDVDNDITSVKLFNDGGAQTLWTSYQYDALDQIVAVTDDKNNVTQAAYDNFGRRVMIDSPDSGKTESVFDLASNLTAKVTANLRAAGQQVSYAYDYNRLASITYPQHPENNAAYTYGGPGAPFNQAGRLAAMTAEGGRVERQYGPLGEVVKEIRTVDQDTVVDQDPTFTTSFRYDTWNRLQSLTWSDGETLAFEYNSGGLIEKITGLKQALTYNYLTFMGYDKFEARERVEYGNGTKTDYAYNPLNRRLSGLLAKTGTGRAFMDMAYGYDAVGNIRTLANNAQVQNLAQKGGKTSYTFTYDDLYQLTAATGEWAKPYIAANKFTLSMSYDSIHNITRKNQYAYKQFSFGSQTPNVAVTYDWSYAYASGKPHAASLIGNRAFLYDLNGNQAGWDATDSYANRRNICDEDNRLQQVKDSATQAVTFKYDDGAGRVVKRGSGGETLYVNPWYVAALGRTRRDACLIAANKKPKHV